MAAGVTPTSSECPSGDGWTTRTRWWIVESFDSFRRTDVIQKLKEALGKFKEATAANAGGTHKK
jgi:hypothetical protein